MFRFMMGELQSFCLFSWKSIFFYCLKTFFINTHRSEPCVWVSPPTGTRTFCHWNFTALGRSHPRKDRRNRSGSKKFSEPAAELRTQSCRHFRQDEDKRLQNTSPVVAVWSINTQNLPQCPFKSAIWGWRKIKCSSFTDKWKEYFRPAEMFLFQQCNLYFFVLMLHISCRCSVTHWKMCFNKTRTNVRICRGFISSLLHRNFTGIVLQSVDEIIHFTLKKKKNSFSLG